MCKVLEDMRNEEREAGRKEGRKEGRREGRREGRKEGRREGVIDFVKKLLSDGALPLERIAEYAGLSLEEVKKLQSGQSI